LRARCRTEAEAAELIAEVAGPIGLLLGGTDFSQLKITIAEGHNGPVVIGYGHFVNAVISFVFIAFAIFLVV
jgi:large conductance mechanosensitive channel